MTELASAVRAVLSRPERFSRHVLGMPLHDYQVAPLKAVARSVLLRQGHEFLFVFPRQSGKNEVAAHLQVYLLNLLQRIGGNIVFAAVGDGMGRGIRRLEQRLDNPWNRDQWRRAGSPDRRCLGKACVVFISSHPQAHSRGETADWLLIVDELQDQEPYHLESVLTPMRAAHNATALYLGTVRTRQDALWQKKTALEQQQTANDRRVFMILPDEVTAVNPDYGRFLANQVARYGRQHPVIRAEYYLEPLDGDGGLFPPRREALMHGAHERRRAPQADGVYVAAIDVAGQDESTGPTDESVEAGRDYTAATIFEVVPRLQGGPLYRAVDIFVDHGGRHFAEFPGAPSLAERLLAFLEHWRVQHVIVDAGGVGEGLADWLRARLGNDRLTPFKFGRRSKAALGNRFVSLIETGRFTYWQGDEEEPLSDGWWFRQQLRHCVYTVRPGLSLEVGMQWSVPADMTVDTPAGRLPVHDDRLISAALVAEIDRLIQEGRLRVGPAASLIVPPADPFAGLDF